MSGNIATKIKKYAAPNLPYAFIAWGFLKLGTAFRMAEGTNLWERLLDSVQHIAPAFSNIAPSPRQSNFRKILTITKLLQNIK